jgi:hypothetical protein
VRVTVKVGSHPEWDEITMEAGSEDLVFPSLPGRPRIAIENDSLVIRYDGSINIQPQASNSVKIEVRE